MSESSSQVSRAEMLKKWLERSTQPAAQPTASRAIRETAAPMSFGQRRLFIQEQMNDAGGDLNVPILWRLRGALDVSALFRAIDGIVERHEVLRTAYFEQGGEYFQQVHAHSAMAVRRQEVTPDRLDAAIAEEVYARFDPSNSPMLRAMVFGLAPDHHMLVITVPHIAFDGASLRILSDELAAGYLPGLDDDAARAKRATLRELDFQYIDFSNEQRGRIASGRVQKKLQFWRDTLQGAPMMLALPTDRPYPAQRRYRARWHPFTFSPAVCEGVASLAQQERASVFMVMLAAYKLVLSRWTGSGDIVVGSPVDGRADARLEPLIGFFVNTLPLRTQVDHAGSFRGLLRKVRSTLLSAIEHQDVPYDVLVRELAPERSTAVTPFIQAEISFAELQASQLSLSGLRAEAYDVVGRATRNDLVLAIQRDGRSLRCDIIHDIELFDTETIDRFASSLERALQAVLRAPDEPLRQLSGFDATPIRATPEERPFEASTTLYERVRECAALSPERIAVAAADGQRTYGELVEEADALAIRLLEAGAGPEAAIAVHTGRSVWLVISLLATWKIGATWVPVDGDHSTGRVEAILAAVKPLVLLRETATAESASASSGIELVRMSAAERGTTAARAHPDALAYIVFTSGTTGIPKGVGITYRNVAHLMDAMAPLQATPGSVSPNVLAPSFDGWLWSTILPLAHGSGVALVNPVDARQDWFASPQAVITLTPTLLATVDEDTAAPATVIMAGEAAPAALVERWRANTRLVNAYGPTETTICATWADSARGDDPTTIGFDMARCHTYVLDERLQPVAGGMPGELFIAGAGVGRGYLRMSGETARRFLPDQAGSGGRMYRTGDRVRRGANGSLEYLGRQDSQLKIRGFRIEAAAIEGVAAQVPGVSAAVAFAAPGAGGQVLCLAIATAQEGLQVRDAVKAHIAASLPDFMQPTHLLLVAKMPRTLAGKVDIGALTQRLDAAEKGNSPSRPLTQTEQLVARVWGEVLGTQSPQVDRPFFDMGGHSLLASRAVAMLRKETGLKLAIRDMMSKPTIEAFSETIDRMLATRQVQ